MPEYYKTCYNRRVTPSELIQGRKQAGLTQQQAGEHFGISQAYLALLESGRRRIPARLATRAAEFYGLPSTVLPLEEIELPAHKEPSEVLANLLSALGYPGFLYLQAREKRNPAAVLLAALRCPDLEVRVVEALPWLILKWPNLDWPWIVREAKAGELQNRLGFLVNLARRLAADAAVRSQLESVERELERARLVREDTLCQDSATEAERRWLADSRPAEARHWNLLTDFAPAHIRYAA